MGSHLTRPQKASLVSVVYRIFCESRGCGTISWQTLLKTIPSLPELNLCFNQLFLLFDISTVQGGSCRNGFEVFWSPPQFIAVCIAYNLLVPFGHNSTQVFDRLNPSAEQ